MSRKHFDWDAPEPRRNRPPESRQRRNDWDDEPEYFGQQRGGSRRAEERPPATRGRSAGRRTGAPPIRRRSRVPRILLSVLLILLLLGGGAFAWWRNFAEKPNVDQPTTDDSQTQEEDPNKPLRAAGDRKDNFYTFLVIGRDTGGGGNTDTILLASYDVEKQAISIMSIPRDTLVNIKQDIKKINAVYNYNGAGDDGIKALGQEVAQLVGFIPDYQVVLEWEAVGELVDALDGVYFDVPRNMYYDDPSQDLHINIKKGYQKLSGEQAMQVVRFRDGPNGYKTGDLGRIETQQAFVKAVIKQCLDIKNVLRIGDLTKVFKENVTTNLELKHIAWFAEKALGGGLSTENLYMVTMPSTPAKVWSRKQNAKLDYILPKVDELVSVVNEHFNPYLDPLKKNELDIMSVDDSGRISSSTGKVEDTKAKQ